MSCSCSFVYVYGVYDIFCVWNLVISYCSVNYATADGYQGMNV